ncbi:MCE family protein [Skermania sp. ID1734]|uniref:MCE family protein n=1 Tax=Skermania sp. ID1734 TaxID=2597516 RepID=UPI00117C2980|nr:MCE family protein [Skermania sp. ID1734]TSE00302.1 MCE family protein [Skermania sp. ID1734]
MSARRLRQVAGVCVLATVVAGCSSGSGPFSNATTVTADFENVAGMYEGNSVDVLGLPVGKIDKITPKGSYVEVQMSFDSGTKVPADVIAAEVSPSVITDRHIELTPAYSGKGPTLANGDHIPLERTRTPVELDEVLKTVDQIAQTLKGSKEDGPLAARIASKILADGNGEKLQQTIKALSDSLKIGLDNRGPVAHAIVRLNEVTQLLADNDQSTRELSYSLTRVSTMLADQAPGLQAVLDQLTAFLNNTSTVLGSHQGELSDALTRLGSTTDLLKQNARQLKELVDVLPLMGQNIANAVVPQTHELRTHVLTDKSLLDNETISLFCERVQLRADGCRTGKIQDMGPDFGLTAAMLGLTK